MKLPKAILLLILLLQNAYSSSISLYVTVIETRAFLSISVQGEDGTPIEGAMITIEKEGKIGTGTTNATGKAVIAIGVGSYNLKVQATGFAPSSYKDLLIKPGENTLSLTMNSLIKRDEVITYPQPAKDRVTFLYWLHSPSNVTIRVYNIALELIATIEEDKEEGFQKTIWDISQVAQGVCFYKIEAKCKRTGRRIEFPIKKLAIIK
jgi:hypothetical protein